MSLRETSSTTFQDHPLEAEDSAEAAGLRYVSDQQPGFTRRRAGRGFTYLDVEGQKLVDRKHLERIASLRIPPAWQGVWICRFADGHLQCTGRDDRGRKQYIYHPGWTEIRNRTKFDRLLLFARKLPDIRVRIEEDLKTKGLRRERVLATIVSLMEKTMIRVGNQEYVRENKSFGLTTLRNHHVEVRGSHLRFHFRGKHGKIHEIEIEDPRLARIVRRCQELPGQELFHYEDDSGEWIPVESGEVNAYLKKISGEDFTAKDFRTWGGSLFAARWLCESADCKALRDSSRSKTAKKKALVAALKKTAEHLGNTVAVCRKYYVHPNVIAAFENGSLLDLQRRLSRKQRRVSDPNQHLLHEQLLQLLLETSTPS